MKVCPKVLYPLKFPPPPPKVKASHKHPAPNPNPWKLCPLTLGSISSHNTSLKVVLEVDQANHVDIIKLVENSNTEEARKSRAAKFELRAQNMGITEARFVAQKVAIWEGMWATKQNGDDIGVSAPYSALFGGL